MKLMSVVIGWFALGWCLSVQAGEFRVVGFNVESRGAKMKTIAKRLANQKGCDIWGLSEVKNKAWVEALEIGAEKGERADFRHLLGSSEEGTLLAIIYDADLLELVNHFELKKATPRGVRPPLVAKFRLPNGESFFFMVNHMARGKAWKRYQVSEEVNRWAAKQSLPVIAVGDYNYDWQVKNGSRKHDKGFDLLTKNETFKWVKPRKLIKTQDSRFNSILDFVFVSKKPRHWRASSRILVKKGDFPDSRSTSDHRPVEAVFSFGKR